MDLNNEARERRLKWWKAINKDKARLARVAAACATSPAYLRQLACSHSRPSLGMARRLGEHTGLAAKWWGPDAWH